MGWWNTSRGEIPRQSARGQSAVSAPDRGLLILEAFGILCKDVNGGCFEAPGAVRHAVIGSLFAEMCSGSEAGSYLRLIDFCITQL